MNLLQIHPYLHYHQHKHLHLYFISQPSHLEWPWPIHHHLIILHHQLSFVHFLLYHYSLLLPLRHHLPPIVDFNVMENAYCFDLLRKQHHHLLRLTRHLSQIQLMTRHWNVLIDCLLFLTMIITYLHLHLIPFLNHFKLLLRYLILHLRLL